MPIGNPNGIGLAYDLSEVAKLLGHQDIWCESVQAFMRQLGDYFRQHNLIEMRNGGGGWDRVTLGSVRAFCIDHGVPIPETIAGPVSTQELFATMRKMQGVAGVVPIPDRLTGSSERKHGGALPYISFIEEYVRSGIESDKPLHSIRAGIQHHILKCIDEGVLDCPFLEFDNAGKEFSFTDAKGRERWVSVTSLNGSVARAHKRIKK